MPVGIGIFGPVDQARIQGLLISLGEHAEKVERYERFLKALAAPVGGGLFDGVSMIDAQEWLAETAASLLDGNEAECPICSTHVHEGPCVGEGE